MSVVRILGIGSPLGDDDLGWLATDILESSDLADRIRPHTLELRRLDRPGPSLIEALGGADLVVILDAMSSGSTPGTIRRLESCELETLLAPVSSHGLGVPVSLELARSLGIVTNQLMVVGIEMGMKSGMRQESEALRLGERLIALIEKETSRRLTTAAGSGPTTSHPGS